MNAAANWLFAEKCRWQTKAGKFCSAQWHLISGVKMSSSSAVQSSGLLPPWPLTFVKTPVHKQKLEMSKGENVPTLDLKRRRVNLLILTAATGQLPAVKQGTEGAKVTLQLCRVDPATVWAPCFLLPSWGQSRWRERPLPPAFADFVSRVIFVFVCVPAFFFWKERCAITIHWTKEQVLAVPIPWPQMCVCVQDKNPGLTRMWMLLLTKSYSSI